MENYRSLTLDEITQLEQNGCRAEDWNTVGVAEGFDTGYVHNVTFYGDVHVGAMDKNVEIEDGFLRHAGIYNATLRDVTIGDNCLVENIGNYINRYEIGEECYISNVGKITSDAGATYGEGTTISVLNEAGDGNVVIYKALTSQLAAFMVAGAKDKELYNRLRDIICADVLTRRHNCGTIGCGVKIMNTREIINTAISDESEINGASRLYDCTVSGTGNAGTYIGNDVICENVVVSAGASVLGGARLTNCFVGEACHVGKGFSAEASIFFANSYMDNGEACAAFCGPFTVSHHKSTLLIGGMFSFYNAGSATNYSNRAYKIGPVHYGTLQRGAKTASGAHILMPATIGAFSMCMGKIQNHPDTSDMPFSYVIASGEKTFLVPGCNLATVGTYRDTAKWIKRDMRPHNEKKSIINFNWLSPYTIQKAIRGKAELERLLDEQGTTSDEYEYSTCVIRNSALKKGIRMYDMAIKMFFGDVMDKHSCTQPRATGGTDDWADLSGMLVPVSEVNRLAEDIKSGSVGSLNEIENRMAEMNAHYDEWLYNWTCNAVENYYGISTMTDEDVRRISEDGKAARSEWLSAIARDAEKEAVLGDMEEGVVEEFIAKLG